MAGLMGRMLGAAKLDAVTYEEVENDAAATPQAMLVVVLASVAGSLGAMRAAGIVGLLLATLASLLGWFLWAFVTFVLGTRVLPGASVMSLTLLYSSGSSPRSCPHPWSRRTVLAPGCTRGDTQ